MDSDIVRAADSAVTAGRGGEAIDWLRDFLKRPDLSPEARAEAERKLREVEDIEIRMQPPDMAE